MRAVFNKLVYDTDKAEEICSYTYSIPDDFRYCYKVLYRTKNGRFFFYGEGGPLSEFGVDVGNRTTAGSRRIWPATEDEAREFCEKMAPNKAIKIWGEQYEEA